MPPNVGSKLDSIIKSQAEFAMQQAVMCNDMKHLIADNVEFKENMTTNVATLKKEFYKTRAVVSKHGIWFTIIHGITLFLAGLIGYKSM